MTTYELLDARETTHGDFAVTARVAQQLKQIIRNTGQLNANLTDIQRESLDMIATKIARIVAGDCAHADHWQDIIGYATLALPSKSEV